MEGLCFPLLFCHSEPGYTNESKSHLSPDEYAMARLLRPEKSVSGYMTAHAGYAPLQYMDGCTGEPFAPTEAQSEVEEETGEEQEVEETQEEKAKRNRRTKAQIEAEKVRQVLTYFLLVS